MNESQNFGGHSNDDGTPHEQNRNSSDRGPIPEHLKLTPYEERECQHWENPERMRHAIPPGAQSYLQDAVPYPDYMDILTWAGNGQSWRAKSVLMKGANVNACDARGVTPLHYAVRNGTPSVVKVLMQSGANPLTKDPSGETPIGIALGKKDEELIDIMKIYVQDPKALHDFLDRIPSDDTYLRQLTIAAENAQRQGNYAESEKFFCLAIKEAEKYGPFDVKVANATKHLGVFCEERGRDAEANKLYDRYFQIMQKAQVQGDFEYADFLISRAKISLQKRNYKDATSYAFYALYQRNFFVRVSEKNEQFCEQAIQICEEAANAEEKTADLNKVADYYHQLGRVSKAEELHLKALEHFSPQSGGVSQYLSSLEKLAEIYEGQQKHEQAKGMREEYAKQKDRLGMPHHNQPWG
jgi:ankyrin repeat protein